MLELRSRAHLLSSRSLTPGIFFSRPAQAVDCRAHGGPTHPLATLGFP